MYTDKNRFLIENILQFCDKIKEAMNRFGDNEDTFKNDHHYHDLCSFYILQIGENVKDLSPELTKKYPDIHWKGIYGTRNKIAHGYHEVDFIRLWNSLTNELPALRKACEEILHELENH